MERACFYLRIFPGSEAEYDRRHASPWPEIAAAIRDSGLRNMSGFRRGTDVWYFQEVEPDRKTGFDLLGREPANQRWSHHFRDVIAQITDDSGELLWYQELFHVDGPSLDGPFQRALFSLVIDEERAGAYEGHHANPRPDLMEAIEASGFRNYTGFRRGAHVVCYGECSPDAEAVFGKMAMLGVNARWGSTLEGLITRITDEDGNLISADEVFHQD
jgi:L-rhamnose mutarotase